MRRLALCFLIACAACGDGDDVPSSDALPGDLGEPPVADPGEPMPAPPPLPEAALAQAATEMKVILARTSYTRSIRVEDLSTGQVVFTDAPATLLKPASNTKLYTTAAALEILGGDHGLTTRVVGTAPIDGSGTLTGDLHFIFEHDFSASPLLYASPSDPIDRLAAQLAARGLRRVTGDVYVAGEPIYGGSSLGTLDVAAERAAMVAPLDAALTAAGVAHSQPLTTSALAPPAGATPLVVREPLPLVVGVSPLNVESHNEFADLLHRHLGWRMVGTSSAAAGQQAVSDWLASTGIPTGGLVLLDGSGLSHGNRTSADATVALMKFMEQQPVGPAWRRSLAIAGVRGTLDGRLGDADTRGRVFAKTGTLSDTIALSGFLEHRHDGQRYVFSFLLNAVTSQATARDMLDDLVRVFARDLRVAAPRPQPPRLRWARGLGWAGFGELRWAEVPGAAAYVVWRSEDGERWPSTGARLYRATSAVLGGLPADTPTYVRVTAVDASGLQSDPSVVHALTASAQATQVVIVDGDDRWRAEPQPENTLAAHHAFVPALASALAPRTLATVDDDELGAGGLALAGTPLVVWAAGEESEDQGGLTEEQRGALGAYLGGGGALLLSGAELAWDLDQNRGPAGRQFLAETLHAGYVADDAGTYELEGLAGGPLAALGPIGFRAPDTLDVGFPDVLSPGAGAVALCRYVGGLGGDAIVGTAGKLVVSGVPLEIIPSATQRRALVAALLAFLGR